MKVRAITAGIYEKYRNAGEVFEVPDDFKLGRWMEPLDKPKPKPANADVPGAGPAAKVTRQKQGVQALSEATAAPVVIPTDEQAL